MTTIGIDVAKATVEVALDNGKALGSHKRTPKRLAALAKRLNKLESPRVIVEATGGMEQAVCRALHVVNIPCFVVSPYQARSFANALNSLAKTDKIDAANLAKMGVVIDGKRPWTPPPAERAELKRVMEERDALRQQRDNLRRFAKSKEGASKEFEAVIEKMEEAVLALTKKAEALIKADRTMRELDKDYRQVSGVGPVLSGTVLAKFPELGRMSRTQVSALMGVAPMNADSGSTKNPRTCRAGRKKVRNTLYMAALSGVRHNEVLRTFYEGLLARGKKKKVALVAVMRKLVIHLNSVARRTLARLDAVQVAA